MGRKAGVLKTYGRHRQRVIAAQDVWASKKDHCSVFSSSGSSDHIFSSSGSVSKFSLSESSSFSDKTTSQHQHGKRKGEGEKKRGNQPQQTPALQNSDSENEVFERKDRNCKRQALKDIKNGYRIEKDTKFGGREKKRNPKILRTSKSADTTKRTNGPKLAKDKEPQISKPEDVLINFSEFDDYSLILSDSIDIDNNISVNVRNSLKRIHSTPASGRGQKRKTCSRSSVDTSTPFYDNSKQDFYLGRLKETEISHIEGSINPAQIDSLKETDISHINGSINPAKIDSLLVEDKFSSTSSIEESEIRSKLLSCSVSLAQFCQSDSLFHHTSPKRVLRSSRLGIHDSNTSLGVENSRLSRSPGLQSCVIPLSPLSHSVLHAHQGRFMNSSLSGKARSRTNLSLTSSESVPEDEFNGSDSLFGDSQSGTELCRKRVTRLSTLKEGSWHSPDIHLPVDIDLLEHILNAEDDSGDNHDDDTDDDVYYTVSDESTSEREDLSNIAEGVEDASQEEEELVEPDEHGSPDAVSAENSLDYSTTCYSLTEYGMKNDWSKTDLSGQFANISVHSESMQEEDYTEQLGHISVHSQSSNEDDVCEQFGNISIHSEHTNQSINSTAGHEFSNLTTPFGSKVLRWRAAEDLHQSFSEILSPQQSKTRNSLCPRAKVLLQCEQTDVLPFSTYFTESVLETFVKIGEGVYGEVFRSQCPEPVAFKVIPIEGNFKVNQEAQKTFEEILPEIVISRELSALREGEPNGTDNFVAVKRVSCVKGKYPDQLLKLWDEYHRKRQSENDRPDIFDESQLFIIFEFGDGGSDVESFKFKNILEVKSVIQQVAFSLAVAEVELEFEHRDLHWGNVLVKRTSEETVQYKFDGTEHELTTHGVHVTVIDFTLSRLKKEECTVFCDLSKDQSLFEGEGDYQFDIYRLMKDSIGNNWECFCPHTNILWLHYLVNKLTVSKSYPVRSKAHKDVQRNLRQFKKSMLDYQSAYSLISSEDFI